MALAHDSVPRMERAELLRLRAERLRALDRAAESQRDRSGEAFRPLKRTVLVVALAELDRALDLDPYDPMLWNLRLGWCNLLERCEESVAALERAIALRPHGYSRPWINKAPSLGHLNRVPEALVAAEEAGRQAALGEPEFAGDITMAVDLAVRTPGMTAPPSEAELVQATAHILQGALRTANEIFSMSRKQPDDIVGGNVARMRDINRREATCYTPIMAQLLSDFPPDVAFAACMRLLDRAPQLYPLWLCAALYLACDTNGARQRDALRFLALNLLATSATGLSVVRKTYRESFLDYTDATDGPLCRSDELVRTELDRLDPHFVSVITQQPAPSFRSGTTAGRFIQTHFSADPSPYIITGPPPAGMQPEQASESLPSAWWRRLRTRANAKRWEIRDAPKR